MSKRRTGRKLVMQLLYQADVRSEGIEVFIDELQENPAYIPETKSWAISLAKTVWENLEECDALISKYAKGGIFLESILLINVCYVLHLAN